MSFFADELRRWLTSADWTPPVPDGGQGAPAVAWTSAKGDD
jgi:hypothetical protein